MSNEPRNLCEGAVQIGYTDDIRAIWERGGELFMVVHDAKETAHRITVSPEQVVRRLDSPIPWGALINN
mgnify:CR=1 FL=1